jgi:hypothetical protein
MCDLNILGTRMEISVLFLEPGCDSGGVNTQRGNGETIMAGARERYS